MQNTKEKQNNDHTFVIAEQGPVGLTERQKIRNIILEKIDKELEGLVDPQGRFIAFNPHIAGLLQAKLTGIFNDPSISGKKLGDILSFPHRILIPKAPSADDSIIMVYKNGHKPINIPEIERVIDLKV